MLSRHLFLLSALIASSAAAQQLAYVQFADGSASADGYELAKVGVLWDLRNCAGDLTIIYSLDPSSISAAGTYWFEGHRHVIPGSYAVPRVDTVRFVGQVVGKGRFSDSAAGKMTASCLEQGQTLGPAKTLAPDGVEGLAAIVQTEPMPYTLRNRDFEAALKTRQRAEEAERREAERRAAEQKAQEAREAERKAAARRDTSEGERRAASDVGPSSPSRDEADQRATEAARRQQRVDAVNRRLEESRLKQEANRQQLAREVDKAVAGVGGMMNQIRDQEERRRAQQAAEYAQKQSELCDGADSFHAGSVTLRRTTSIRVYPGSMCDQELDYFWLDYETSESVTLNALTTGAAATVIVLREGAKPIRIKQGTAFELQPGRHRFYVTAKPGDTVGLLVIPGSACWLSSAIRLEEGNEVELSTDKEPPCSSGPFSERSGWLFAMPAPAGHDGNTIAELRGGVLGATLFAAEEGHLGTTVNQDPSLPVVFGMGPGELVSDSGTSQLTQYLYVERPDLEAITVRGRSGFAPRFAGGLSFGFAAAHTTVAFFTTERSLFDREQVPLTAGFGLESALHLGVRFHSNLAAGVSANFHYTGQQLDFVPGPFLRFQAAANMFRMNLMVGPAFGMDRIARDGEPDGWGSSRWGFGLRFEIGGYNTGRKGALYGGFFPAYFKLIVASGRVTVFFGLSLSLND